MLLTFRCGPSTLPETGWVATTKQPVSLTSNRLFLSVRSVLFLQDPATTVFAARLNCNVSQNANTCLNLSFVWTTIYYVPSEPCCVVGWWPDLHGGTRDLFPRSRRSAVLLRFFRGQPT